MVEYMLSNREYCRKLSRYRKRAWSCKETRKAGLTYEEALLSEARAKGAIQQVSYCTNCARWLANALS